jgi:hypothetical protein
MSRRCPGYVPVFALRSSSNPNGTLSETGQSKSRSSVESKLICRAVPKNETAFGRLRPGPSPAPALPVQLLPARLPASQTACCLQTLVTLPKVIVGESNPRSARSPYSSALSIPTRLSPHPYLRLSFPVSLSERLSCSLNLIEPHPRPDHRNIPTADPGTTLERVHPQRSVTILATLLLHLASTASAGTHALLCELTG